MYKAVIFDLDDTLYAYEPLHQEALDLLRDYTCTRFHISPSDFSAAFVSAKAETKRLLGVTGSSHNRLLYCQKTLEFLCLNPVDGALEMYETYWGYLLSHMTLREGALDLLQYCKDSGIKVGICTDLTAHIQHRKLRALGIVPYVDAFVTSEEAGAEKPDARMFRLILEKLSVTPKDALFIGDSLEKDVLGAQRAGIKALWLHPEAGENYPSVATLKEIRRMLDAPQ